MATHRDNYAPPPLGAWMLALGGIRVTDALFRRGLFAGLSGLRDRQDCHEKEFCVANKCQQCRDSNDCPAGHSCKAGKCERSPATAAARPTARQPGMHRQQVQGVRERQGMPGRPALREGDLQREEAVQERQRLPAGRGLRERLLHQGEGARGEATPCTWTPCSSTSTSPPLTTEATAVLARDAECLKQVNRPAQMIGHTDPRGTQEYNLALSERRAQSVRDHLGRLGVDGNKLTDAAARVAGREGDR
jgi:peptidoglycan-associated lipoprotein